MDISMTKSTKTINKENFIIKTKGKDFKKIYFYFEKKRTNQLIKKMKLIVDRY